ncbi:MAG: RHS repeat-associated core domain-containing protein [Anaerolineales bacterium]|nr:RHS repeat-associated core domain-containing protein [Anaerolineales bacterium]
MFYNARWYDPSLGRFSQADPIVPDGIQGLDRYAYSRNNPVNYIDPTGHDDVPWWQIIKFFATQLIDNQKITDSDWRTAANTYLPARASGSNLTVQASVVIFPGSGVVEANYVTSENGDFQLYITTGGGAGSGAGAAVGYSQGSIYGTGFVSADDFSGTVVQVAGSGNLPVIYIGAVLDGWFSVSGADGDIFLGEVYGYDVGATVGTPGVSVSTSVQNAIPAQDVLDEIFTQFGIRDTSFGDKYYNDAKNVSRFGMNGFQLFGCRLAQQCGRWTPSAE